MDVECHLPIYHKSISNMMIKIDSLIMLFGSQKYLIGDNSDHDILPQYPRHLQVGLPPWWPHAKCWPVPPWIFSQLRKLKFDGVNSFFLISYLYNYKLLQFRNMFILYTYIYTIHIYIYSSL